MEKIVLNSPGIYVAQKNGESTKFLVAITGKAPMLRVNNVISLAAFANGVKVETLVEGSQLTAQDIYENPDSYTYSRFDEIPKLVEGDELLYTPEEYKRWIGMKRENIIEATILQDICKSRNIEYPQAKEIWKQICLQG